MSNITPQLIKGLREKTGAGMMDCKKALVECDADLEAAVDWLRKKGLSAAAKKSGRVASEGLISIHSAATTSAVVELNAETDFVARNTDFQGLALNLAKIAAESNTQTAEDLAAVSYPGEGENVQAEISRLIGVIGENMNLRRVSCLSVNDGVVATYVHGAVAPNIGKIGVLVALESSADKEKLAELGKKIAMHVAAASPQVLSVDDVDPQIIERERQVFLHQARESGRPENVIEKMVEGRIRKYHDEIVLLEQAYVIDGKTKIKDVVAQAAKELGSDIQLKAFTRYGLGEGIEKEETDFAAEVQSQAGL